MKRLFHFFVVVAFILATNQAVRSQDYYNFVQFYVNPSLINPAFTGIDGQPAAFLSYKRQWMGITGTPSIGNLNIQAPLPSKLSVGLNFNSDTKGLLSTSSFLFSGSYYVPVTEEAFVRFGFSLGSAWNKVDIESLNFGSTSDAVVSDLLKSSFQPMGNAGLSFHTKTFQIGASVPNIFQPAYLSKDAFTITEVKPFESIILQTSYRFYFSNDLHAFEPYILYRLNSSLPSQLEVAGIFHLQNMVWLGGSYKQDFGISAMAGYKLNKLMGVGYSYTLKNTGLNELSRPSHEIQLAMLFGVHQKKTPTYSFVNAEKEKGKKHPTHIQQQYYAKNNPKSEGTVGKPRDRTGGDPLEESSPSVTPKTDPAKNKAGKTNTSKAEAAKAAKVEAAKIASAKAEAAREEKVQAAAVKAESAKVEAAKVEAAKVEAAKVESAKVESAKTKVTTTEAAKTEAAKAEAAKAATAKVEAAKVEAAKTEAAKAEAAKTEAARAEAAKAATAKVEAAKVEAAKADVAKTEVAKVEAAKVEAAKANVAKTEVAKIEAAKVEAAKAEVVKTEVAKVEAAKAEAAKVEAAKVEATKAEVAKTEAAKVEAGKVEAAKVEAAKATGTKLDLTRPDKFESKEDSLQHHDEVAKIDRLTKHADDPTEQHNEEGHPHAERHEFVRRGNHVKEMDLGDFVIVGVFRSEANAKHMSDELKKLGFSEVDYGYLTEKAVWYIHIADSEDIEEAKTKRNKYRKMKMFKDAWLLTVHQ